jgi:dTMP kinase
VPRLTLVIDIDVETGLARAHHRNERAQDVETRLDEQSLEFHRKVRAAYHQLVEDEPKRVKLIDGSRETAEVADEVWSAVQLLLTK